MSAGDSKRQIGETATAADLTAMLRRWCADDRQVLERVVPRLYPRWRRIASDLIRGEPSTVGLETGDLVHETFLRLRRLDDFHFQDREHFYALSARLMRRLLIDRARYRDRLKRRAERRPLADHDRHLAGPRPSVPVAVREALADLARIDRQRALIVELRYFVGLEREQIARLLGISSATVTRRWRSARAWLLRHLSAR